MHLWDCARVLKKNYVMYVTAILSQMIYVHIVNKKSTSSIVKGFVITKRAKKQSFSISFSLKDTKKGNNLFFLGIEKLSFFPFSKW